MRAATHRSERDHGVSRETFFAEIDRWAERLGVSPLRVQLLPMRRKWASCSPAGRLTFSRELLSQDAGFRTVVIVHELLHLRIPNHGKLFRSFLSAHVPGWQRITAGRARAICTVAEAGAVGRRSPNGQPSARRAQH